MWRSSRLSAVRMSVTGREKEEVQMLDENYVTFEIGKTKHIALVAHDGGPPPG